MNPHKMEFEKETEDTPKDWVRFKIGELIPLKGYYFKVKGVGEKSLVLEVDSPTGKRKEIDSERGRMSELNQVLSKKRRF